MIQVFYAHNTFNDDYEPNIILYENSHDMFYSASVGFGALSKVEFDVSEDDYRLMLVTTHESGVPPSPMDILISEAQTITKIIQMLEDIEQN